MADAQVLRDLAEAERIRRGLDKGVKRGADQPTLERAKAPVPLGNMARRNTSRPGHGDGQETSAPRSWAFATEFS